MFIKAHNSGIQKRLQEIREKGELKPVKFGFKSFDDWDNGKYLMASRGVPILLGGEPHAGKTQFTYELISQLMEGHDFKVALMSSEGGGVAKVFSDFYGLHIGKHFSKVRSDGKENKFAMNDYEADIAQAFINERLYVFESNSRKPDYKTIDNFYKMVAETERLMDIKFDCVCIDPIYDIDDFEPSASEVHKIFSRINQECETNNRVDIVVNHVSETGKYVDKNGQRKKFVAMADEFYGGKNNQRKAFLMLLVHRPDPNINPETPEEYVAENQSDIYVLKAKPDGIAFRGVYDLYYDWKSRRYYEMYNGNKSYAQHSMLADKEIIEDKTLPTINPKSAFLTEEDTVELPF